MFVKRTGQDGHVLRLWLCSSCLTRFPHGYIHQADTHPCVGVLPAGLIDYCPLWAASQQKTPSGAGWTPSLVVKLTCINSSLSNFSLLSVTGTVVEAGWHLFGVFKCQLAALWGDHSDLMCEMSTDSILVLRKVLVCRSCSHLLKFIMNLINAPHAVCPTLVGRL